MNKMYSKYAYTRSDGGLTISHGVQSFRFSGRLELNRVLLIVTNHGRRRRHRAGVIEPLE